MNLTLNRKQSPQSNTIIKQTDNKDEEKVCKMSTSNELVDKISDFSKERDELISTMVLLEKFE